MMGAIWYRARAGLRRRWRSVVVIGVLGGILAGAAMASAAGARRTHSAYPRFLEQHQLFDVAVQFSGQDDADRLLSEVASHPMVEASSRASFYPATLHVGDRIIAFPDVVLVAMDDRVGFDQMKILEGSMPDLSSEDHVVVGYAMAERYGLRAGDRLQIAFGASSDAARGERHEVTIAAVMVMPGSFETITGLGFPSIIVGTPAFDRRFEQFSFLTDGFVDVRLKGRERAIEAFSADLVRRGYPTDGPPQPFSDYTPGVQALNRIPVVALWAAAGLLGLAAVSVIAQAMARESSADGEDVLALRSVGMPARAVVALGAIRAVAIAVVAILVGSVVAVALSPLTPLGIARIAEPSPGLAVDMLAIGAGAGILLLALPMGSVWPSLKSIRLRGERPSARRSRVADALARVTASVPVASGVRFALSPGRTGVPGRQAMTGAALATVFVVAALVFVSSFHRLLEEPRLTGHTWDASIVSWDQTLDEVEGLLPPRLVAQTWHGSVFPLAEVEGLTLTAHAGTGPPPSIIEGRTPATPHEVALDPVTLERLGKQIGDTVRARDAAEAGRARDHDQTYDLTIVGSFIVPRIVFQPNENVGQGALFSPDGFDRVTHAGFEGVFVRFAPGLDPDTAVADLREAVGGAAFAVLTPLQRGMVRNMERISIVPLLLAAVCAVIGASALTHALASTIGRRRRDLAILKTLGFISRQVRSTIRWQALTFGVIALLVGVPLGAVAGRVGWLAFAEEITVVPEPITGSSVVLVVPAVLVLVLLVSAWPARAAASTRPAVVLRSD